MISDTALVADPVVVRTARSWTAEEFAAFIDARRDGAVRLAFRLLGGDQATAEDVAQNAFLRAHRARAGFRGESSIDTWFYRIVVREVQRHRRWWAVRRLWSAPLHDVDEPADQSPTGDAWLRRRIGTALQKLSRTQREVFVLVHLEGHSLTDAAAILGKAVGTVKSHLHRALCSLRQELRDVVTDEDVREADSLERSREAGAATKGARMPCAE